MEIWSGIDVGKKTFQASWVPSETSMEDFRQIPHKEFPMTRQGVTQYLKWMEKFRKPEHSVRAIMETTGLYSLELHVWLMEKEPELAPAIVNARLAKHFHQSLGLRNKTDSVDARSLGLMGRERKPKPFQPLQPEHQELRDLMRQRRVLVQMKMEEKDRLEKLHDSSVGKFLKSHIKQLKRLLQRVDQALDKHLQTHSKLRKDVKRLMTIPGVGRITALTVLGELGDLRRFERSRQISAMTGLSPHNVESGTSTKHSQMDRMGSPEVRKVLFMASMATIRSENHLSRTYQHLINDNGLCKMEAMVAVMRKTLVLMRALLISESDYQDDYNKFPGFSLAK